MHMKKEIMLLSQSISPLDDLLFQFECLFRGEIRIVQEVVVVLLLVLGVQLLLQGFGLLLPDLPSDGGHIPEGMVEEGVCLVQTPAKCIEDVFHCSVLLCLTATLPEGECIFFGKVPCSPRHLGIHLVVAYGTFGGFPVSRMFCFVPFTDT